MQVHRPVSLYRFLMTVGAAAFLLNWIWEMVQMPAYTEMAGLPWSSTARRCTVATFGDVAITFAIYAMGALAAGTLSWGVRPQWNVYAAAAVFGASWAIGIEWWAIATSRWSYNSRMPIVPIAGVGLWPLLQLTTLVPLAFWIAAKVAAPRGS